MNKQKILKIVKILAVVLWIALLVAPTIYGSVDVVTMKDFDRTYDATNDTHNFEVYVDKVVVEGRVTIGFYDEYENLISSVEIPFEGNNDKTVEVSLENRDINEDVDSYNILDMQVKTSSLEIFEAVMYPIAVFYLIALFAILKMNVASTTLEGKEIEVYAGVFKQTLKVNGVVLAKENKMVITKPISLMAVLDDGINIFAQIDAKHRISIYSQEVQKQEAIEGKIEEVKEQKETQGNQTTETDENK